MWRNTNSEFDSSKIKPYRSKAELYRTYLALVNTALTLATFIIVAINYL